MHLRRMREAVVLQTKRLIRPVTSDACARLLGVPFAGAVNVRVQRPRHRAWHPGHIWQGRGGSRDRGLTDGVWGAGPTGRMRGAPVVGAGGPGL